MREPSLHIKYRDLEKILKDLLPKGVDYAGFTKRVFIEARPYSVNTRSFQVTSERGEKKAKKILASSTKDADLMARMVYAVRIKLKHRGVQHIKPTSRDWGTVKELAKLGNDFCLDYSLDKREGYITYITLGASKMKTFNLTRIPNMHESISRTFEATQEISKDPSPELTAKVHEYYRYKVARKTGIINNFKGEPEKYVFFVRVAKLISDLTVQVSHFIDAQFEAMEYRNSFPEPPQLIGQKAKERLNKYLYEHNIRIK